MVQAMAQAVGCVLGSAIREFNSPRTPVFRASSLFIQDLEAHAWSPEGMPTIPEGEHGGPAPHGRAPAAAGNGISTPPDESTCLD